jgi:error-prone DNA polymerase
MSPTPRYAELHAHSAYSFGSGASQPEELVQRAHELGYSTLALTDHDSLSGAMEHALAANAIGIEAIQGAELTIALPAAAPGPAAGSPSPAGSGNPTRHCGPGEKQTAPTWHITLLVEERAGWRSLCRLITLAHAHTRDSPDRSRGEPSVSIEQVCDHVEGLVCLTGCASHGIEDEPTARRLLDAFGPQHLRVELQRPYLQGDAARNRMRERLARRLGVPTVATGGVHAHTPARALLQDALVAVKHGLTLDASEALRRGNRSHVLARPEAMAARFAEHPNAVVETLHLAERLQFRLTSDLGYRYPGADSRRASRELAGVCAAQFAVVYPASYRRFGEAQARLEQELATIETLGLSGFFLLHHEILELAREVAAEVRGPDTARALLPPGRGRGSSVSSIVCYLTGLSHIDPIEGGLAIGRFLHEDVAGLPDIDIDFPRDVREKLIPTIHERYGKDRTALVAAFPTYRSRGSIRDLGKALGLPPGEIERVARASEGFGGSGSVAKDVQVALGKDRLSGRWEWLVRLAQEVHRLPRGISQHSGGMVLATQPLIDCCPIVPTAMAGRQVVQWDKDSCSDAGLLKIDILGLGMLSAVERCVDLISQRQGEPLDLSRIPFDDEETFTAIRAAETTGVFQIESRAQMGSLYRTQPKDLKDLTIQVALVRPGPIVGGSVSPYIERRQRLARDPHYKIPHLHPSLIQPLTDTLGTIIFQDQVIEVAIAFAGFSAGEAEGLRRAMSRKRSQEAIDEHHERFVQGALTTHHDVDAALAEQVWSMVAGFAGFGFPKAHGAAFGLLAYQSTWLRVHHPAEFLCSLLNEQPMGFYPPDSLIHEAQRRGLKILAPEVNASAAKCTVVGETAVRIGLSYVKGVRSEEVQRIVAARGGGFTSLEDLAARAGASSTTLQLLAWSGACDELAGGGPRARRTALWQLGLAAIAQPTRGGEQLALQLPLPRAPRLRALPEWDALVADYASTGVSIGKHPMQLLRERLRERGVLTTHELRDVPHGSEVAVGGLVIARQRPQTANGIVFLLLEDEGGTLNVIVPAKLYETERLAVRTEPLVLVRGRLERHPAGGGATNLLARSIERISPELGEGATVTELHPQRNAPAGMPDGDRATGEDFKASVPPVQHFAQGRRR